LVEKISGRNPHAGKSRKMITHTGSVTYRQGRNEILYLIISSSDGTHWVLPKGHIEPNESPEETALRELREEAGIVGEIVDKLPIQSFETPQGAVTVQYFLIKELGAGQASENRMIRWEVLEAALQLLSFENTKVILREGSARAIDLSPILLMRSSESRDWEKL
jgi:8-oxo-dGTP pyrophosphatase MutT (NUDIX family)